MNQNVKIFVGLLCATAFTMLFMKISKPAQSIKSRRDPKKPFKTDSTGKVTDNAEAGKSLLITGVTNALKGSSIDIFQGVTPEQFSVLSVKELSDLQMAILSQKKFRSESLFRQSDPKSFQIIIDSAKKITGKNITT